MEVAKYIINTESHVITRSSDNTTVFKGIDWSNVFFGEPPANFSWTSTLCRIHNWMDGHFMGVWWDDSKWMIAMLGDHTVSRIGGTDLDPNAVEGLMATCDIREHPFKKEIIDMFRSTKFTSHYLPNLNKEKCYTFVVSAKNLRAIPLTLVDCCSDETNLGYGIYHICTRNRSDWSEDTSAIMGVRQPLVRHLINHKETSENVCAPCMSFIGLVAMETFSGLPTTKTARRVIYMNPFWMSYRDLKFAIKENDQDAIHETVLDIILNKEVSYAKARPDVWKELKQYIHPWHKALIVYTEHQVRGIEDDDEKEEKEREILENKTPEDLINLLKGVIPYVKHAEAFLETIKDFKEREEMEKTLYYTNLTYQDLIDLVHPHII